MSTMLTPQSRDWLIRIGWCLLDAVAWFAAVYLSTFIRYSFNLRPVFVHQTFLAASGVSLLHILTGCFVGPYRKKHQRGSFEELLDLVVIVAIVGTGFFVFTLVVHPSPVPRTVPVVGSMVAALAMMATRFMVRSARQHQHLRDRIKERVIVYGAGNCGRLLIRDMQHDPLSQYVPVGLIDDDRTKRHLRVDGVPVRGDRSKLSKVAASFEVTKVIIAMPGAGSETLREVRELVTRAGLRPLVVPALSTLVAWRQNNYTVG